jgi:hypothetical protein
MRHSPAPETVPHAPSVDRKSPIEQDPASSWTQPESRKRRDRPSLAERPPVAACFRHAPCGRPRTRPAAVPSIGRLPLPSCSGARRAYRPTGTGDPIERDPPRFHIRVSAGEPPLEPPAHAASAPPGRAPAQPPVPPSEPPWPAHGRSSGSAPPPDPEPEPPPLPAVTCPGRRRPVSLSTRSTRPRFSLLHPPALAVSPSLSSLHCSTQWEQQTPNKNNQWTSVIFVIHDFGGWINFLGGWQDSRSVNNGSRCSGRGGRSGQSGRGSGNSSR